MRTEGTREEGTVFATPIRSSKGLAIGLIVMAASWLPAVAQTPLLGSSDLPIVLIITGGKVIGNEPKTLVDLRIIDNGPGKRNYVNDPPNNYNGKAGIEIRGSSSQMFPKKQYAVELRDANDLDITASVLGFPVEGDWIFFAPYNDKTLMRDALAYHIARSMGRYASRWKFFELVIDNEYKGVYVLLEKIKRDEFRVNIDKLEPAEKSGEDLTGGYILKLDKTSGGSLNLGFNSKFPPPNRNGNQTIFFQHEYPKGEDITTEQATYISNYIAAFEEVMAGDNFKDPVEGYAKYIDVASFIDFFIVNEVSKNADGYRLSTFLHKKNDEDGGKIYMGPVWDFNLGFGNVNYCTNSGTSGFVTDFNTICPGDFWLIPFWWKKLWEDPTYRTLLYSRWSTLRKGSLATGALLAHVDSVATALSTGAQQRNFQRWPVLGTYIWPNPPIYSSLTTYELEVSWLKDWITARMAWLDANLAFVISGVDEHIAEPSLTVYPNPIENEIGFAYSIASPGEVLVEVYDQLGRKVGSMNALHATEGSYTTSVPSSGFAAGVYYYSLALNGCKLFSGHLVKR